MTNNSSSTQVSEQIALPLAFQELAQRIPGTYRQKLISLLCDDLDFHDKYSLYAAHNFHSFPAKFPPQLPAKFIRGLTNPGDTVLDPMMGSGTTILEGYFNQRKVIGFDIDPLALMISKVKVTPLNEEKIEQHAQQVLHQAKYQVEKRAQELEQIRLTHWDEKSFEFIEYWFSRQNQIELLALLLEIEKIQELDIQLFLKLVLSAVIITKSGGVSLALDLAHTRPHRAKLVFDQNGQEILNDIGEKPPKHLDILTKTQRSPFAEFEKKLKSNLKGVSPSSEKMFLPMISSGNAQNLPLKSSTVDLIITSPPYASNAIDYMRAHKFSLIWLGYPLSDLSEKRQEYIGGELTSGFDMEIMPEQANQIIQKIAAQDVKKGQVVHRYYSEMTRVLKEMYRVLKPGRAAIVVVGSSIIRDIDTETQNCLEAIGKQIGFDIPKIGIRNIDRNRRMLPAGNNINRASQIQQRMHEEYVIGFYKTEKP
jgi:DNA modification methylase